MTTISNIDLDSPATAKTGCAVCNPALRQSAEEHMAELRPHFFTAEVAGGHVILQVPGRGDEPFHIWSGPFASQSAASLFLNDLLNAIVDGQPGNALCSDGIYEEFNLAGRLLDCIGEDPRSAREIALRLASERPWIEDPDFDDVPF